MKKLKNAGFHRWNCYSADLDFLGWMVGGWFRKALQCKRRFFFIVPPHQSSGWRLLRNNNQQQGLNPIERVKYYRSIASVSRRGAKKNPYKCNMSNSPS
jgi:hypothetical protein